MRQRLRMLCPALIGVLAAAVVATSRAVAEPPVSTLSLTDGSRLIGAIPLDTVPISSTALGELKVPLDQVRLIKFDRDHTNAVLTLANGDKLHARVTLTSVKLETCFGTVLVPAPLLEEWQIQVPGSDGMSLIEWEAVPFPRNSDWPGSKGRPAEFIEDEIILHGQPVRARPKFTNPLTVKFEVSLDKRSTDNGALSLDIFPTGARPDLTPLQDISFLFMYHNSENWDGFSFQQRTSLTGGRVIWENRNFSLEAGRWYKIQLEFSRDHTRITVGDRTFETNVAIPYDEFQLQLHGTQPPNAWRVRFFSVR